MKDFTRFRGKSCPICQGTKNNCATSNTTGLIHCRSISSFSPDYYPIKLDNLGFMMWGLVADRDDWTEEKRRKWEAEKEERLARQREATERKIKLSLPAEIRDREIRKILEVLELNDKHQQKLSRRGLTPEQIENNGYRSVKSYQKLGIEINSRLAGISYNGTNLNNKDSGILCPIKDYQGRFIGLRINNDHPSKKTGIGKYTWVSSSGRGFDNKLPITELIEEDPIAVHHPLENKNPERIYICEGPEYKSAIAAERLQATVIGISGNNFAISPLQVQQVIRTRQKEITPAYVKLIFIPDSGINELVAASYLHALDHYKNQNPLVAWWNQEDNKGQDIDEIPADTEIKLISSEEAQRIFEPLSSKEFQEWKKERKFTSDIKFNEEYITNANLSIPEKDTITFIKSALGTGKTTLLKKWLEVWEKLGAFSLGCRNTLLHNFCESAGFYHIHEDNFGLMRHDPTGQFALCVDSLLKFKSEDFDNKILILDEVCSIIPHLLTSSTIPKHLRNYIIDLFKQAIRRANRVICLDGNLANWAVEFLTEIAPDKKVVRIENEFKPTKPLFLYRGSLTNKGKINNRDRSGIIDKLLSSKRPAIVADSQSFCEQIDYLLSDSSYATLRIDSTTVGEPYVREFLANPDKYLSEHDISGLILSPSAESGLDIAIQNYFSDCFVFAYGTLSVNSIRQLSQRIRDDVPTHLWVNESPKVSKKLSKGYSDMIEEIIKYSEEKTYNLANKQELIERLSKSFDRNQERIETLTAERLQRCEQIEKSNYLNCVVHAFTNDGYVLNEQILESCYEIKQELKRIRTEIHEHRAQNIFHATDLTEAQIKNIKNPNEKERFALIKANLKKQLPGIEETPIWHPEFIYDVKFKYPNYLRQIDNAFLFDNPLIADALHDKNLRYLTTNLLRDHDVSLWEFNHRYALIQGLREVGLETIINAPAGTEFTYQSKEIKDIHSKLRRRPKLREKLGIENVGKYAMKEVNRLLRMIGCEFVSHWKREGDRKFRVYTFRRNLFNLPYRDICLELTKHKWLQWIQNEITNLSDSVNQDSENLTLENIAKLFSLHSLKLATQAYSNLSNKQALSVTKDLDELDKWRLLEELKDLQRKIAEQGISKHEDDSLQRASILEQCQEMAADLAAFIEIDWMMFVNYLNTVGDSV
ncbi:MAG: plasmid replication protein, CyRepA1 family, partial [Xenococcus sp. (in: cyanobacteria)]